MHNFSNNKKFVEFLSFGWFASQLATNITIFREADSPKEKKKHRIENLFNEHHHISHAWWYFPHFKCHEQKSFRRLHRKCEQAKSWNALAALMFVHTFHISNIWPSLKFLHPQTESMVLQANAKISFHHFDSSIQIIRYLLTSYTLSRVLRDAWIF